MYLLVRGIPVSIMSHREVGSRENKAKTHQVCWEIDEIQKIFYTCTCTHVYIYVHILFFVRVVTELPPPSEMIF